MTPEESQEYNAIVHYNIDGIRLKSTISDLNYVNFKELRGEERWDSIIKFIKHSVDLDLQQIKERLIKNEIR